MLGEVWAFRLGILKPKFKKAWWFNGVEKPGAANR